LILIAFLLSACNESTDDMNDFYKLYGSDSADAAAFLTEIAKHKVIFGHQSVGQNILSGVNWWEEEEGINLNKMTTRDFAELGNAVFVDFNVGANGDPNGKTDDFASLMDSNSAEPPTLAFFKFCYVDIVENSDVDAVFDHYKEKMLELKNSKPDTRIILITVPLTTIQKGLKATAKRVLSMNPSGYAENVKRTEFNERMLNELSGDFPVFDLAKLESTLPDGKANTYSYEGMDYPCLVESYASDSGHLNDYGSRMMAFNLLAFLAGALK